MIGVSLAPTLIVGVSVCGRKREIFRKPSDQIGIADERGADGDEVGASLRDLGRNHAGPFGNNRVQLYQRGIADELTDVPGDAHVSIVSGPQCDYQVASRM